MIEVITDWIYNQLTYYNIMILVTVFIGLCAGYIHKNGIPILWTGMLAMILYFGQAYLKPMLTGLYYFDTNNITFLSSMLVIMSILWILIMGLTHYNLIVHGKAVN